MEVALEGADSAAKEDEGEDGAADDAEDVGRWERHDVFFSFACVCSGGDVLGAGRYTVTLPSVCENWECPGDSEYIRI